MQCKKKEELMNDLIHFVYIHVSFFSSKSSLDALLMHFGAHRYDWTTLGLHVRFITSDLVSRKKSTTHIVWTIEGLKLIIANCDSLC